MKNTIDISSLDCRFTSAGMAEISGSHCPIDKPCQRCELEKNIDNLNEEVKKLKRRAIVAEEDRESWEKAYDKVNVKLSECLRLLAESQEETASVHKKSYEYRKKKRLAQAELDKYKEVLNKIAAESPDKLISAMAKDCLSVDGGRHQNFNSTDEYESQTVCSCSNTKSYKAQFSGVPLCVLCNKLKENEVK